MKVVVAMQRRKFLMNAVVGEMKRREATLGDISEMEAEAKLLKGKSKFKLIHDIKTKVNEMNKSYAKRQQFVASMKGMIDKANVVELTELQKYQAEMAKDDGRSLTLTEAIDEFGREFDLKKLRKKARRRVNQNNGVEKEEEEKHEKKIGLRGIISRGSSAGGGAQDNGMAFWYDKSKLKVDESEAAVKRKTLVKKGVLS